MLTVFSTALLAVAFYGSLIGVLVIAISIGAEFIARAKARARCGLCGKPLSSRVLIRKSAQDPTRFMHESCADQVVCLAAELETKHG